LCPADQNNTCYYLSDGESVDCATWLDIIAQNNVNTACSKCPGEDIEHCVTQSGTQCLECAQGYYVNSTKDKCLLDNGCNEGEESTAQGCVVPVADCESGYTVKTDSGNTHCKLCKPGFRMTNNLCEALDDPANCDKVELTNPYRKCIVCADGFQKGSDGLCTEIPD